VIVESTDGGPLTIADTAGADLAPYVVRWSVSDSVTVALAAGLRPPDDLEYLYEGSGPRTLPTMASVVAGQWLVPLLDRLGVDRHGAIYRRLGARLERPIPPAGEARVTGRVSAVDLGGPHARLDVEVRSDLPDGPLVTGNAELVLPGRGRGEAPTSARSERHADALAWTETVRVDPAAALIYRTILPLTPGIPNADAAHVDPALAVRAGWKRPAVHGVSVLGALAAAALRHAPGQRICAYRADFRRPVAPGDELELRGTDDGVVAALLDGRTALEARFEFEEDR
jgi:hypothetical protein